MSQDVKFMESLIGLEFDQFSMAKYAVTFHFSGKKDEEYYSYKTDSDCDMNFDPSKNYTNKQGDAPPNLEKIWNYIGSRLDKFNLSENGLSCSFHFEGHEQPIVFWKDPEQFGELLVVTDNINKNWWTI